MSDITVQKEIEEIKSFIESIDEVDLVQQGMETDIVDNYNIPSEFDTEAERVLVIQRHPQHKEIVNQKLAERFDTEDASYVGNLMNGDLRHIITVRETRTERGLEPAV